MLGGAQGARAHQRAEGVSGGEAGVLSKCERKRRTRQRPSLFCCARGGIFAFCMGGVLPRPWHFAAVPVMRFVGAGVLDGPFIFSEGRVPRPRARVTFGRSGPLHRLSLCLRRPHFFQQRKKWGKERRQKPMVFGFPFARLQLRYKKVPQRIACTPIPAAAPTYRIAVCCSTNIKWRPLGPHQHLPPLAASGRFDNRYGGRPAQPPAWYVGAAAIRGSQVIRCTTICSDLGFAWCMAAGFGAPQARRKS